MSNVSSYYTQPYGANLPVQPVPQVSSTGNGTYNVSFDVDTNTAISQGASIATKVAPVVPGAVAGHIAQDGVSLGIHRARSASRARYRSMGMSGRYGSSGRNVKRTTAVSSGSSTMFGGLVKAVKSSVLWGGAISLGLNGYKVFKGEQNVADAGKNVTGDVASAAVGGAAGAVASSIATPMLASAFGARSFLVSLGGFGVGIAGFMLADHFLRKTAFFQNLTTKAHDMIASVTSR